MEKMRRNVIVGLVSVLCGLLLWGCGKAEINTENVYQVYYIVDNETRIEARETEIPDTETEQQVRALLDHLGKVPEKMACKAPLAMGFQVLDIKVEEGKVLLDVDVAYDELSTTTEVLVRAAIVRTLTQLKDISHVGITIEGNPLFDSVGDLVGLMSSDQFINNDGNDINTYELIKVKLYFANETGDQLISAYREKHYSTNTPLERFVVEELIAGPSGQIEGLYPTINHETKILSVMTKDGICYVNLDASFLTVENNVSTEVAMYSIVNSLAELNQINKVQILINGEAFEISGNNTFERNLDFVTSLNPS